MKYPVILALTLGTALALPKGHAHAKREPAITTLSSVEDVVTDDINVTVYVDDDATYTDLPESPTTTVAPELEATSANHQAAVQTAPAASQGSGSYSASPASSSGSSSGSGSGSSYNYGSAPAGIKGDLAAFQAPTGIFEDGKYDCSEVPTGQGVIRLDWLGYNGWASIMKNDNTGAGANQCTDGYLCSYACQSGMSKTQWPSSQPADGQSRGGLLCKNGKLYKTNSRSNYLCEWGKPTANAVSKLSQVVSICRTDYPGSENMVIPTRLTAGSTVPITVPDQDTYYKWQGKPTSAQYYVNDAGVDISAGCIWSTAGTRVGNWAPVNFGAGYSEGVTYLSIIPNPNFSGTPPAYSVKIEASSGSTQNGHCVYSAGKYNGAGTDGCTVGVTSGSSNFVFY